MKIEESIKYPELTAHNADLMACNLETAGATGLTAMDEARWLRNVAAQLKNYAACVDKNALQS